ncbi:MAG: ATP-binding protein [Peptococcaceae bacterium]
MRIAVASGKGGTGKTTVSSNLAYYLSKKGRDISLIDCDVEEPNNHIFFQPDWYASLKVTLPVPEVDIKSCSSCGKCSDFCQFGAIICIRGKVLVFPELCHGCGGCAKICPQTAIKETTREIGEIQLGMKDSLHFIQGVMRIGEAMSPPLINEVKACVKQGDIIIDCPPGTSCPMIQAVKDSDFVLLVTEPTPFGLHDLKLAVATVRQLNLPFAVGLNRSTIGDERVKEYCKDENIEIILEIPEDREIAQAYSQGKIFLESSPHYEEHFAALFKKMEEIALC